MLTGFLGLGKRFEPNVWAKISAFIAMGLIAICQCSSAELIKFSIEGNTGCELTDYVLYGYLDPNEGIIVKPTYSDLYSYVDGSCVGIQPKDICKPWKGGTGEVHLIDKNGRIITVLSKGIVYQERDTFDSSPFLCVERDGAALLIDRNGNEVPNSYAEGIRIYKDFIRIIRTYEDALYDFELKQILDLSTYQRIHEWYEGEDHNWYCVVKYNGLYGVINQYGEWRTMPTYKAVPVWGEGSGPVWPALLPDDTVVTINIYGEQCEYPENEW